MDEMTLFEENLWEAVLDVLSEGGRLARYYRVPRNEMKMLMKVNNGLTSRDIVKMFFLIKNEQKAEAMRFVNRLGDERAFCMLKELSRSMKCWVETGSSATQSIRSWPIAHA
ncbi:hypothetical protein GW915_11945 [bacterium]|nr:hypothetical protein [bacterium]